MRTPDSRAGTLLSTMERSQKVPTYKEVSLSSTIYFLTPLQFRSLLDPLSQPLLLSVASKSLGEAHWEEGWAGQGQS